MRSSIVLLAFATTALAALPQDVPRSLFARQSVATSSALADIITVITKGCTTECDVFIADLSGCAKGASQAAIATCACSSVVLGSIRSCAACISADPATTTRNSTAVVADYNSFVDLCTADGLAAVTGTIAVGAATSSIPRTSSTPSSTATGAQTYSVKTGPTTTASVASLAVASGTAAAQVGTSGAARVTLGWGMLVLGFVGLVV